jgi:hypothetical protein
MGKPVTFDTACLAQKKGFTVPVLNCYNDDYEIVDVNTLWNYGCEGGMCLEEWYVDYNSTDTITSVIVSAPTQSELQDWLREEHNINIYAYQPNETGYWAHNLEDKAKYDTYEEAIEEGLQEALYKI